ncbi:MAG: hypothetical protein ACPKQO_05675 [Nitrososphaeraceae archaeon]
MFRGFPDRNTRKKLVCKICKHEEIIPKHHDKQMAWQIKGSFEKIEYFYCQECGFQKKIPLHCNAVMFYSESEYDDIPTVTNKDLDNINNNFLK